MLTAGASSSASPGTAGNPTGWGASDRTKAELPATFVPNRGHWDDDVRFAAWKNDVAAAFPRDAIRFSRADGPSVRLRFRAAKRSVQLVGEGERDGRYHFVFGDDPTRWRTGVTGFGSLLYRGPRASPRRRRS